MGDWALSRGGREEMSKRKMGDVEIKEYPSDDWDKDWMERVIEDCRWRYEVMKRVLGVGER